MVDAADVEAGVGKGQRAHERAQHVVRLEAEEVGHTRGPVPVLHRPAPGRGDERERGVRVDRVRRAHAREERDVEDAVAAGVAVGQVDAVLTGPFPHCPQLARAPDEALVEAPGVAAVAHLVGGGDEVVEAEGLGEGRDHVGRRGGREHQLVARGPEGAEVLGREGSDQLAQTRPRHGGRPPAPGPGANPGPRRRRPAPGPWRTGSRPGGR